MESGDEYLGICVIMIAHTVNADVAVLATYTIQQQLADCERQRSFGTGSKQSSPFRRMSRNGNAVVSREGTRRTDDSNIGRVQYSVQFLWV